MLIGFSSILMQAFMSSGRPGVVTALLVVGLLVNVLGMLLLVPPFGLSGAAFAVLIATIVRLAPALFPAGVADEPSPLPRGKDGMALAQPAGGRR